MGLIIYRRFYTPMGAVQLELGWGDWFSVPPLTVPFSLRMDTLAGVLCGIVTAIATLIQSAAVIRGIDHRARGALSAMTSAILLFILADNLVTAAAAEEQKKVADQLIHGPMGMGWM